MSMPEQVLAESGSGKSSLLAKAAQQARESVCKEALVIVRFLGKTVHFFVAMFCCEKEACHLCGKVHVHVSRADCSPLILYGSMEIAIIET
jgi:hypothetical protein